MAHNSLIHAGGWLPGYVVTTADFVALDTAQFKSINGDDGGTWAPAAVVTIGGAGLTVSSQLSVGTTLALGSASVTGSPTISAAPTLTGTWTWTNGAILLNGTSILVASAAGTSISVTTGSAINIGGGASLSFAATSTITGTIACSANCTFSGTTVQFTGAGGPAFTTGFLLTGASPFSLAIGSTFSNGGIISNTATGHIRDRVVTGVDGTHTYAITDADEVQAGALTAARTYTVTNTGAAQGDRMRFGNQSGFILTLRDDAAALIYTLNPAGFATTTLFVDLVFHAGQWRFSASNVN